MEGLAKLLVSIYYVQLIVGLEMIELCCEIFNDLKKQFTYLILSIDTEGVVYYNVSRHN